AGHMSAPLEIDVCTACQAFWFDKYESLKLSSASTLKLMKLIGANSSFPGKASGGARVPTLRKPPARDKRFTAKHAIPLLAMPQRPWTIHPVLRVSARKELQLAVFRQGNFRSPRERSGRRLLQLWRAHCPCGGVGMRTLRVANFH